MAKLFISLLTMLFFIPVVQTLFPMLSQNDLAGVIKSSASLPQFNLKDWNQGLFQEQFQTWFQEKLGLRKYYIRLDNQINFSIFKECKSYNNAIVLGKNNWLYERTYINSYKNMDRVPREALENRIKQMKELQDLLEQKGIVFLFIISPNKAVVYPENIPKRYLRDLQTKTRSNYDDVIDLLNEYKLHYQDGHQYFLAEKNKARFRFFLPGGTHWSHYGAYMFCLNIIKRIENLGGFSLGSLSGEPLKIDNRPTGTDRDLAGLMNVLNTHATDSITAHPTIEVSFSKQDLRPDILMVGSSFSHHLTQFMSDPLFNRRDLYYYYKRNIQHPIPSSDASVSRGSQLKKKILEKQVVIIESNESALWDIGFGFIQEAVKSLASPSFQLEWASVKGSDWYHIWINDMHDNKVFEKWYQADEVESDMGMCAVDLPGYLKPQKYKWWIQTWNNADKKKSPWSDAHWITIQ